MPTLKRIEDVGPDELLQIEAPWQAMRTVEREFFDSYAMFRLHGLNEILRTYNPFTTFEPDSHSLTQLLNDIDNGSVVLLQIFDMPFSPVFSAEPEQSNTQPEGGTNTNLTLT